MTPAPGKKRGRKPTGKPWKVRTTITLDPQVKADAEALTLNFSDLVETLLKKEIKRHRHPGATQPKSGKAK
jgi:hypothetical protein